jgi:hypothetical protein
MERIEESDDPVLSSSNPGWAFGARHPPRGA